MAALNRLYAVYVQALQESNAAALSSLLDALCSDQGLVLDTSSWQGEFPHYSNAGYNIDVLKGQITGRLFNAILVSLPMQINHHPAFEPILSGLDLETMHVHLFKQGDVTVYVVTDKQGLKGRIEEEKEEYRFYKKFPNREKELQVFSLKEFQAMIPLYPFSGDAFYIDPETPQEGLCFDEKDKLQFKINFTCYKGSADIKSVIDCRRGKESKPYQIHPFDAVAHAGLKKLEFFENPKEILLFSSEGKIKKIEFKRYGLSFSVKGNKLMCLEPKYKGYFVDLTATLEDKKGIPYALLMRHEDEEMPIKLFLPAASVIKREVLDSDNQEATLNQFWSLATSYLRYASSAPAEQSFDPLTSYKPKHTQDHHLKYQAFTIRPCTEELLAGDEVQGPITLLKQAMLHLNYLLALKTLLQLKLQPADLSKDNINIFLEFLQVGSLGEGHEASIKIQFIFMLKNLMEDKAQYILIKEKLDTYLFQYGKVYLSQCKKIDQRLLLNKAQFNQVALAVKQKDAQYFNDHFQLLYLDEDVDIQVVEAKKKGDYGFEQIPLEDLEAQIKAMEFISVPSQALSLSEAGIPLLYKEDDLISYFTKTNLYLPPVKLPRIDPELPSCEKIAVQKLEKEMEQYRTKVQQEKRYVIKGVDELKKNVEEQRKEYTKLSIQKREIVENLLHRSKKSLQRLALKGGMQAIVSFQELSIAFLQKNLQALQNKGLLPEDLDIGELEGALKEYFEAEVIKLVLRNASSILTKLQDRSIIEAERWNQSTLLFQLLTTKRFYSSKQNPELLVYECFAQKVFRQLNAGRTQIHLLKNILENPNSIFQAKTGDGKTSVISILWGLIQADGNNLVVFKLLPTLLEQSKSIFQEQLGIPFEKRIYYLQFNLKISPVIREKRKSGILEHSLFKQIYHHLLVTIKNKGCVLTDYKSFPLMQEKWIKLNREFAARRVEGLTIPDLEKEHWFYLRKILILLKGHEKCMMDEFDIPNRSCNRLQIPLGKSIELPAYFHERSLELYEFLKNDDRLKLSLDQQRDLFEINGKAVLLDLAKHLAQKLDIEKDDLFNEVLLRYLTGEDEDVLDMPMFCKKTSSYKDIVAFYKDQICTFLPLALSKANGLGYKRSEDGLRTIPCPEGEPQENSRHGHPIEEINYMIQDHIQIGVSLVDFKNWMNELQEEAKKNSGSTISLQQYQQFFPGEALPVEALSEQELIDKLMRVNKTWEHVKYFLVLKLKELEVSGEVISMNPHDAAAMPKNVSAVSATLGCPDELPKQLKNSKNNEGIIGEMIYRLLERTARTQKPIEFIPERPYEIFKKGSFTVLIDGGAFYRKKNPKKVAEELLSSQPSLAKVGYYDEKQKPDFAGKMESTLVEKGFFFSKTKSRGADVALQPDATALLTVDGFKTIEDLVQNDGRMRLKGQKIQIVRSFYNPEITSTESLLALCARNEGKARSPGLYNSKMLEISHLVRTKAFFDWLDIDDFESSLDKFMEWQSVFIQKPAYDYNIPGSYFKANKHQRKINCKPLVSLMAKKKLWLKKAEELRLHVNELESLTWSPEVIAQMPDWVAGPDDKISTGLEVEEEVEIEHEVEREMDIEMEEEEEKELQFDQCGDVPFYPPWKVHRPKEYSVAQAFHPAFDSRIYFLENFLPIERKDSLYKRNPFDKAMPRIRVLHFITAQLVLSEERIDWSLPRDEILKLLESRSKKQQTLLESTIAKIIIGDVLDDVFHRPYRNEYGYESETRVLGGAGSGSYDLRTHRWISCSGLDRNDLPLTEDFQTIQAQVKFLNGDYENYSALEWKALRKWLGNLKEPEEMRHYFAKVILKTKPRKAEAFKMSPLFQLFDEIALQKFFLETI
jgi:Protein of unknown function (DUF3638)